SASSSASLPSGLVLQRDALVDAHSTTPTPHSPTPSHDCPTWHASAASSSKWKPLSVAPSQYCSRPSPPSATATYALPPGLVLQRVALAPEHSITPAPHSPTPSHAVPSPKSSSVLPSQSSSALLHCSTDACDAVPSGIVLH